MLGYSNYSRDLEVEKRADSLALPADAKDRWMCQKLYERVQARLELEEFALPDSGAPCYSPGLQDGAGLSPGHFFKYRTEAEYLESETLVKEFVREVGAHWPWVEIFAIDWKRRFFGNRDWER